MKLYGDCAAEICTKQEKIVGAVVSKCKSIPLIASTHNMSWHNEQCSVSSKGHRTQATVTEIGTLVRVYWHFREELNSWCGEQRGGRVTGEEPLSERRENVALLFLHKKLKPLSRNKSCHLN